ncbi:MAG TPA: cytochrome P450, partial [Saprospiraceae bacterium]|nr:cytochrome P450 [Saprospiraceae bacterium]
MKRSKLPPGPKTKNPLGHLFSFRRDIIGFLKKIAHEYGDIVHFKLGPIRIVLLNHPDHIKEVLTTQHRNFVKGRPLEMAKELLGEGLLTSEGEFHKRQSRLIQPAFHRNAIESCATAMTECSANLMDGWSEDMQVDIKEEMTNMSIAIAGKAMFGTDIKKEAKEINKALDTATDLFGRIALPFSEWLLKLPIPSTRRFFKAKARLDDTIYGMIAARQRNKVNNRDLLSLLLNSQDEKVDGGGMNDQQVRDEALTLFLTAFDTTSTALTWVWYLLSQNPEAEAELHEELDRVLEGRVPTAEDVANLKYTRMVLGESMRMFPPSYVIPRQALENFPIDKYVVPRGTIILMSPYLIHHDSRFHTNPEKFDPRAWDKHSRSANSKYEFFPFSRGPRACIGEPFAWMQGILVLASIAQFWRIKLAPGHPVEMLPLMNLRP